MPQRSELKDPAKTSVLNDVAATPKRNKQQAHAPNDPKEADWNAAELLAAARKTVSFGQCRFRAERRSTTKRGWRID
jgi:hypothetical protein